MTVSPDTGKARVWECLQDGQWHSTPKIADYAGIQANTTQKWLNDYWKKVSHQYGYVLEGRPVSGKAYYEYRLAKVKTREQEAVEQWITEAKRILADYPLECPERVKIEKQIEEKGKQNDYRTQYKSVFFTRVCYRCKSK